MSGVLTPEGQYERCNVCAKFVLIQHLHYEQPTREHPYGRDLCSNCVKLPFAERERLSKRIAHERALEDVERYERMGWTVRLNDDDSIRIIDTGGS